MASLSLLRTNPAHGAHQGTDRARQPDEPTTPDNSIDPRWRDYERRKEEIAMTARSEREYYDMIRALLNELGL